MKIKFSWSLLLLISSINLISCQNNSLDEIQGVYIADKESLKNSISQNINNNNAITSALLDKAIENAIVEFRISEDSINGLILLLGQPVILNSKISIKNDSLITSSNGSNFYLIPNNEGIVLRNKNSKEGIQLVLSENIDLKPETKKTILKLFENEKAKKEFTDNLGRWKKGNYVDEFGDKTGKGYPYSIIKGEHENSSIVHSEVFIKASIEREKVCLQIFNNSMTLKENFPNDKFGMIKIKFENGDVKNEEVFYYKNTIYESSEDDNNIIYNHLLNDKSDLKIRIDLSNVSKYYSDIYQFVISKNNLEEVLDQIEK